MFEDIIYIIGQMLGIVAVILGFVSFQMKTPRGILIFQIIIAFVFSLHYLLIGAYTAVVLNFLAAVQSIISIMMPAVLSDTLERRSSKSLALA